MLAGGYSWRLYFYVEIAFGGLLLLLAFFFVEESHYNRASPNGPASPTIDGERKVYGQDEVEKEAIPVEHVEVQTLVPPRRSFLATLKPWSAIDHSEQFFLTMARSFTYFLVPAVLWVVTTYGIYIGLGALVFNYTFPVLIVEPPYNWKPVSSVLEAHARVTRLTCTSGKLWLDRIGKPHRLRLGCAIRVDIGSPRSTSDTTK